MHYTFSTSANRLLLAMGLAVILISGASGQQSNQTAQSQPTLPPQAEPSSASVGAPAPRRFVLEDYAKPFGYFPNPVAPYLAHHVPAPNLTNSSKH